MFSNVEALAIVNTATQASCIPSLLGQAIDLAMYRHFVCYSFYRKKIKYFFCFKIRENEKLQKILIRRDQK